MGISRILLVDSHDRSRQLLARLLRMSGFTVVAARTAGQAQALTAGARFDWLISEISPPDCPEFALMRSLHASNRTRGIVATAHDLRWADGWQQAGFNDVLRKPLEFECLLAKLQRHRNAPRLGKPPRRAIVATRTRSFARMSVATATLN